MLLEIQEKHHQTFFIVSEMLFIMSQIALSVQADSFSEILILVKELYIFLEEKQYSFHHNNLWCCLSIYTVLLWVAEFWRYRPLRCLPSLQYNGTRWHYSCGAQSTEKYNRQNRNHDPVAQNNPQTLVWADSCRSYFLSAKESIGTTFCLIAGENR